MWVIDLQHRMQALDHILFAVSVQDYDIDQREAHFKVFLTSAKMCPDSPLENMLSSQVHNSAALLAKAGETMSNSLKSK